MELITKRLLFYCKKKGLNANKIAIKLGLSHTSVSKLLKGVHLPSSKFLIPLKEHFPDLDMNWLIAGQGEMQGHQYDFKMIELLLENKKLLLEKIKTLEKKIKDG